MTKKGLWIDAMEDSMQPMQRAVAEPLERLPEAKVTEGVSIDDFSTWRAVRFADRDEGV